ncbi:hypothetical protein I7I50_05410 [Histoplasma capsulatum G186AR]|nr:hypothetical protein I7I52_03671 [Histoplasma capsulatum]QSS76076.1 hypothetical protein I7I50_05410 [Histoplasma capsulatum G186AR]
MEIAKSFFCFCSDVARNRSSAMWYLLYFVVVANSLAFAFPSATVPNDRQNPPFVIPEPTKLPLEDGLARRLVRRATTQQAEATICGYYAGSKQSRLACYNSNACVFHSSNANFPAMVGCCPTVSTTTPCTFISTCYGSSQFSATPSLRTYSNDPFVMLCTGSQDPHCHTRTWPGLSIADYQCTYSGTSSGAETMFTIGSLTDVKDENDQITETMSISWVGDSVLLAIRAASATITSDPETTAPRTAATESNTARPGDDGDDDNSEDSASKPPIGPIVGGVVGGVGGLLVLVLVLVFVWRRSKRKPATATAETAAGKTDPEPPSPLDGDLGPVIHEMHGVDAHRRHELMPERTYVELPEPEVRHQLE